MVFTDENTVLKPDKTCQVSFRLNGVDYHWTSEAASVSACIAEAKEYVWQTCKKNKSGGAMPATGEYKVFLSSGNSWETGEFQTTCVRDEKKPKSK